MALISARSEENARAASQFQVTFRVQVMRGGASVSGATVTIGSTTLSASDPGDYRAEQSGYLQTYSLEVAAGADSLTGARLEGPAPHAFSTPTKETLHPAGQPLPVLWAPAGADSATIKTEKLPPTMVPDTGSFEVPGVYFPQEDKDRVQVLRKRQADLGGGAPGSTLTISIQNQVELHLRPN